MTDDIVTRLIYCTDYDCDLLGAAAREIERLRDENEGLRIAYQQAMNTLQDVLEVRGD